MAQQGQGTVGSPLPSGTTKLPPEPRPERAGTPERTGDRPLPGPPLMVLVAGAVVALSAFAAYAVAPGPASGYDVFLLSMIGEVGLLLGMMLGVGAVLRWKAERGTLFPFYGSVKRFRIMLALFLGAGVAIAEWLIATITYLPLRGARGAVFVLLEDVALTVMVAAPFITVAIGAIMDWISRLRASMRPVVREASEDDLPSCLDIAHALPESFNARGLQEMEGDLRKDRFWVALRAGRVAGFVAARGPADGVEEMTWLAVRPDAQHRGVGMGLVVQVLDDARSRGARTVRVKTRAAPAPSAVYARTRRFYLLLGFRLKQVIDPYPGWDPGNPCAIYERPLSVWRDFMRLPASKMFNEISPHYMRGKS